MQNTNRCFFELGHQLKANKKSQPQREKMTP